MPPWFRSTGTEAYASLTQPGADREFARRVAKAAGLSCRPREYVAYTNALKAADLRPVLRRSRLRWPHPRQSAGIGAWRARGVPRALLGTQTASSSALVSVDRSSRLCGVGR
jgi:hypothetical protein